MKAAIRGRLIDLSFGVNRKQRVMIEIDRDFRGRFDELKDGDVTVEIGKWREPRSKDANAYFWVLAGKLGAKLRISPEEVYRQYIPDVADNYVIQPVRANLLEQWNRLWCKGHLGRMTEDMGPCRRLDGYHNVRCYFGSSDYDAAQMSRLIDLIVADCKDQGIETLTPDELSRMKLEWGAKDAQADKGNGNPSKGQGRGLEA